MTLNSLVNTTSNKATLRSTLATRVAAVALLLLAAGCTNQTLVKSSPIGQPNSGLSDRVALHQQSLKKINKWQLRGKIGVRSPDYSGSAFINWQQQQETFDIRINGPLGQGSIHIKGTPENITLAQNGAPSNPSLAPKQQLKQALGWDFPAQQLRFWAIGLPAPHSKYTAKWNSSESLETLEQDYWKISFQRYTRHKTPMPEKIVLQREDIKLTLIIKKWNISTP